ncbi:MAG: hypothetical protein ACLRM9_01550 [Collinsella aerofaciens]
MGIKTVAVTPRPMRTRHVQLADEAYCIGGPRLAEATSTTMLCSPVP